MSRPFAVLVAERSKLPSDVLLRHATERLTRWAQVSSGKLVSLDEVAWLGAIFDVAIRQAAEKHARKLAEQQVKNQMQQKVQERQGSKVHTVVLTDGVATQDGVA